MNNYILLPGSAEHSNGDIITLGTCTENYTDVKFLRGTSKAWFGGAPLSTTLGERIQIIREKMALGETVEVEQIL